MQGEDQNKRAEVPVFRYCCSLQKLASLLSTNVWSLISASCCSNTVAALGCTLTWNN